MALPLDGSESGFETVLLHEQTWIPDHWIPRQLDLSMEEHFLAKLGPTDSLPRQRESASPFDSFCSSEHLHESETQGAFVH